MVDVALKAIEPQPIGDGVVEKLEQVLERARAGHISAVAIAVVERDGLTGRAWSTLHAPATMIGAVEIMKRDIIEQVFG